MARQLIINADDFGLTEGVSRGILRAHHEGIVTSTTFMVNFPWAADMAPLLRDAPELGVGVHLNLTTGTPLLPVTQVRSLVTSEGRFCKSLWHLRFRVDPHEAGREWSAQVERAIELLGGKPTHLDTHRYLQGLPALAEVMVRVARAYNIPAVRCLYPGLGMEPGWAARLNPTGMLMQRYLRRSLQVVSESGLGRPDALMAGDFDLSGLLRSLDRVGEGVTELVCHPGLVDEYLLQLSSLREQREIELAALTAPAARERVASLGIALVSYRRFGAAG